MGERILGIGRRNACFSIFVNVSDLFKTPTVLSQAVFIGICSKTEVFEQLTKAKRPLNPI
jgi:hypothetical protein